MDMTPPPSPAAVLHEGHALFFGTGSFSQTNLASNHLRAGFWSLGDFCLDALEHLPAGSTYHCRLLEEPGPLTTTTLRRGFVARPERPAAPAPAPAPAPVPPFRLKRRLQKPGARSTSNRLHPHHVILDCDGQQIGPYFQDITGPRDAAPWLQALNAAFAQGQRSTLAGDLALLLASAAARVEVANKEGDLILSGWLPGALAVLARARAAGLL